MSPSIVCSRYSPVELEQLERAAAVIMGDGSLGLFQRASALALSAAILEAHANAGGRGPGDGWGSTWIEGTLEEKP